MDATLLGSGAVAQALATTLLGADAPGELAWRLEPADRRRWLARPSTPAPTAREGQTLRWSHRSVVFEAPSDAEVSTERVCVDARDDDRPLVRRPGRRKPATVDPAAVLAVEPLLRALEGGPGYRWVLVNHCAGRRATRPAPLGLAPCPRDEALASALGRRLPATLGKIAFTSTEGPQLGDSLELSVLLGRGGDLASVRDSIANAQAPRILDSPGARSDDALGRELLLLDTAALDGVGPLVRVVAHFDPAAWLAEALRRLL